MYRKSFKLSSAIIATISIFSIFSASVSAAPLRDSVDQNDGDWDFYDEDSGTSNGVYVLGPGTPPAGTGSAELSVVDGTGGHILYTTLYKNTPFSDISYLEYSTYRSSADVNNILAISLQLNVDYDLTDGDTSYQGRLVYEPYQSGASVPINTWQTWYPLTGSWWATRAPGNTLCPQSSPCSWATIRANYPNAGIRESNLAGYGLLLFKAGHNWDSGFRGNVDNLIVGINGSNTTYDFGSNATSVKAVAGVASSSSTSSSNKIWEGGTLSESFSSVSVNLDTPLYNPAGNSEHDDVTNPINYSLVRNGTENIAIDQITYDNHGGAGPYDVSVYFNDGQLLPNGDYRFTVEGDTSVVNLDRVPIAGDGVHSGTDFTVNFSINVPQPVPSPALLPDTGFPHGEVTRVDFGLRSAKYTSTGLELVIPKLDLTMPIVGVPQTDTGWDVTWLGESAGYLAGSAFPTWAGNTVITGHVWDSFNRPGAFAQIKSLSYGDQVQIHAWGLTYTYEVRESKLVSAKNTDIILQSEEYDWITLLTCEFYNPFTGEYLFRRAMRAVLVDIE